MEKAPWGGPAKAFGRQWDKIRPSGHRPVGSFAASRVLMGKSTRLIFLNALWDRKPLLDKCRKTLD
jgi:hypothetical protein